MEKNNPINSVYLIALALASMILFVNTLMEGVVFAVCIIATFLIQILLINTKVFHHLHNSKKRVGSISKNNKKTQETIKFPASF